MQVSVEVGQFPVFRSVEQAGGHQGLAALGSLGDLVACDADGRVGAGLQQRTVR